MANKAKYFIIAALLLLSWQGMGKCSPADTNLSGDPAQINNEELQLHKIKESIATKEESAAKSKVSAERFALWSQIFIFLGVLLGSIIGFRKRIKIFLIRITWGRYLKRVTELFKVLCVKNTVFQRYLTASLQLYTAESEGNKLKALTELRQSVCDSGRSAIPVFMIEGGLKIVTNKCKDKNEGVSGAAFNCFSTFYTVYKQLSPEVFLAHFAYLFSGKNKKHVQINTIIEFCAYAQSSRPSTWPDNSRFVAFMKEILDKFSAMQHWSDEDIAAIIPCIRSMECIQDLPDAVNELLLAVTDITDRDINSLLNSYYAAISSLKDISQLDCQKSQLACAKFAGWLKRPDLSREFKDNIIPALINRFNPQRGLRKSERVVKIRKIRVYSNDRSVKLFGELINISEAGVCLKLSNYSVIRKTTQFRRPGEEGFLLKASSGQEIRLGETLIEICKSNGKETCLSVKCELLRAWIPPSSSKTSEAGFGAMFCDGNNLENIRSFITSKPI
ncbi:MAG: hypothetical protein PHO42_06150 [Candidatus Omnitrophica bacterium]|nr:hypothetical protein [Candidatus Omnitrophota bacterium]